MLQQIAMGANMNQTIKAITEAEAYDGPSLIIAYATCINHGIKNGLSNPMNQMKKAVECGYWHLWRYNPELKAEGKNPFALDSKNQIPICSVTLSIQKHGIPLWPNCSLKKQKNCLNRQNRTALQDTRLM